VNRSARRAGTARRGPPIARGWTLGAFAGIPSRDLIPLAAAVALFLVHAALLRNFLVDDAFIVYRVARNIASGLGPVFNPGERVEAFSDPLFTFLLAPFAAVAPGSEALPAIARLIGLAAGLGSLLVLATMALPGGAAVTALALMLCAASTSMTLWSVAGLETSLYGFLILAAARATIAGPRSRPAQFGLGLLLATVLLSRPEGALPAGALLLWRFVDRETRREWAVHARIALVALALPIGYLAFRRLYFGEWVPNTYFAKHAALSIAVPHGLAYLREFVTRNGTAWFFLPGLIALASVRRHPAVAVSVLVLVSYLPYVVLVGGDWMDAHRFMAPMIPFIAILLAVGWVSLFAIARDAMAARGAARPGAAVIPAGVVLAAAAFALANVPNTLQVRNASYVNARPYYVTVGRLIGTIAQPHWRVATDDIGAIGWYARIRVLDLLGLANPDMAHRRTTPQKLVADHVPGILILHYDDSRAPRSRWRTLSIADFDSLYVRPRGPVPLPGSLRVSRRVLPWVEARLAELPASLDTDLVHLDAYLAEHQPDMKSLPAGVAP
jgi:hypothetical protein